MAELEITSSFCFRKKIRNFLNKCIFDGDDIKWLEEKHIGGSLFYIKGDEPTLDIIYKAIRRHSG